jgi:hypothetical protein
MSFMSCRGLTVEALAFFVMAKRGQLGVEVTVLNSWWVLIACGGLSVDASFAILADLWHDAAILAFFLTGHGQKFQEDVQLHEDLITHGIGVIPGQGISHSRQLAVADLHLVNVNLTFDLFNFHILTTGVLAFLPAWTMLVSTIGFTVD